MSIVRTDPKPDQTQRLRVKPGLTSKSAQFTQKLHAAAPFLNDKIMKERCPGRISLEAAPALVA